ncbi:MAG: prepilin-type N-terminal cleavage/methylation domain-containing protein [bacterium]|nr:prepilin-type N-terminal cleavage/methylation domain-containing protein [bacterium]
MDFSARSTRSLVGDCRGYSLIELIVVLIIIGVIASVAMKSLTAVNDTARIEETKRELAQIAHAIVGNPELVSGGIRTDYGFVGDNGRLPANLNALLTRPGGYTNWDGPYISDEFSTDGSSSEYKNDGWGRAYSYSGGLMVISTGGSSTITRTLANSTGELLRNNASFTFTDLDFTPPGPDYQDSVRFVLTYPRNGSLTSRTDYPSDDGFVTYDSVPIGLHTLRVIYLPDNDTLTRKISVSSGQDYYTDVQYFADLWTADTSSGGGGGGASGSEILRPNGGGASSQLTDSPSSGSNWQKVDETTSDGGSTYVRGNSSSWRRDSYTAEDHTAGAGTIDSVVIHVVCRRQGGGNQRARTSLRVGGSYTDGSTINLNPVSSFTDFSTTHPASPATSSAWSWTEVDAMEIGVSIQNWAQCTQVWAEVFYTN